MPVKENAQIGNISGVLVEQPFGASGAGGHIAIVVEHADVSPCFSVRGRRSRME